MDKIPFIITIDTEGDNQWADTKEIFTTNTKGLPRFQDLCNRYGYKPVYLTNYEMACDDEFVEFGKTCMHENQCEIGMHLHAWSSPPLEYKITERNDKPYLCEYPEDIIDAKVRYMTELLEHKFETKIISHRAGRWAMNDIYFDTLKKYGYLVDCSVTPGVDWSKTKGLSQGNGGTDYSNYPHQEYFLSEDVDSILEVPVTILPLSRFNLLSFLKCKNTKSAFSQLFFKNYWLRPSRNNLDKMKKVVKASIKSGCSYLEFMIHSSELSAGLSPTFKTTEDNNRLFDHMESLFEFISDFAYGCTLKEFYNLKVNEQKNYSKGLIK